jgi:hypothetical protein
MVKKWLRNWFLVWKIGFKCMNWSRDVGYCSSAWVLFIGSDTRLVHGLDTVWTRNGRNLVQAFHRTPGVHGHCSGRDLVLSEQRRWRPDRCLEFSVRHFVEQLVGIDDFGRDLVCPSRLPRSVRWSWSLPRKCPGRAGRCPGIVDGSRERVGEPDPGRRPGLGLGLVWWTGLPEWIWAPIFRSDLYSF